MKMAEAKKRWGEYAEGSLAVYKSEREEGASHGAALREGDESAPLLSKPTTTPRCAASRQPTSTASRQSSTQ